MAETKSRSYLVDAIDCFDGSLKFMSIIESKQFIAEIYENRGRAKFLLGKLDDDVSQIKSAKKDCEKSISIYNKNQLQTCSENASALLKDISNYC